MAYTLQATAARGNTPPPGTVRTADLQARVVSAFQHLARRSSPSATVLYDQHMGSDTNHYKVMKEAIDQLWHANGAVFKRYLRGLTSPIDLRVLSVGGGTGEIESYILRTVFLPLLKSHPHLSATLVLTDAASNMLEIAKDKIESVRMQMNGGGDKLTPHFLTIAAEDLNDPSVREAHPVLVDPFHLILCSYIEAWFANRNGAYRNIASMLVSSHGRMLSMEEHPLIVTPSTSLPKEFIEVFTQTAQQAHLRPEDLMRFLRDSGFATKDKQAVSLPLDAEHTLYARLWAQHPNFGFMPDVKPKAG